MWSRAPCLRTTSRVLPKYYTLNLKFHLLNWVFLDKIIGCSQFIVLLYIHLYHDHVSSTPGLCLFIFFSRNGIRVEPLELGPYAAIYRPLIVLHWNLFLLNLEGKVNFQGLLYDYDIPMSGGPALIAECYKALPTLTVRCHSTQPLFES